MNIQTGFVVVVVVFATVVIASNNHHGFSSDYDWIQWPSARDIALKTSRPLMILVHRPGCPACERLKPKISENSELKRLSKHFVMVNVLESEANDELLSTPEDGGRYVPRILFFDSDSTLMDDVINENGGNEKYRFFYYDAESIASSMKKVISRMALKDFKAEL